MSDSMSRPEPCDLMVRNGLVITVNPKREIFPQGAIAIAGNRILAVGPENEIGARFRAARTIDAQGGAVHPGFIDPHTHMNNHLIRTALPDDPSVNAFASFAAWFNAMEDEDEYAACLVACAEMARNGFTAVMDPGTVFEPEALAAAARAAGVRVSLADPFIWDTTDGGNTLAAHIRRAPADAKRARDLLGREVRRKRDTEGLVHAHVAIYGSGSASKELEIEAKRLADAHAVTFNQHQNFTPEQTAIEDARFGGGHNLLRFEEWGLLGANSTFTHMNVVRDDEAPALARSAMSIVWHPGNYQYYGIAAKVKSRMVELKRAGVNLVFCVDVAKIWTFGDMARIAYLVARQGGDYLSPEELIEMQTIGAARALGLDRIAGSIEPGKRADIVIRSDEPLEAQPGFHPITQMIMLSQSRSIRTVVCNGEIILSNGRLTRLDEAGLAALARKSARKLAGKVGMRTGSPWPLVFEKGG